MFPTSMKLLRFRGQGVRTSDDRSLVGHVQHTTNYSGPDSSVYDCFDTERPTYYFNTRGEQVSYLEHAQFIFGHSFSDVENEVNFWVYPMLKIEDRGVYVAVILDIVHYERKLYDAPKMK